MKKKTIALLLVMMMVFGITVGGTIAYLTDTTETVKNTFTFGKVDISLKETVVNEYGVAVDASGKTKEAFEAIEENAGKTWTAATTNEGNEYKLIPGQTYTKDPTITVEAGSEDCWVFVKVENGLGENATIEMNKDWKQIDTSEYYLYEKAVSVGAEIAAFDEFVLSGEADVEALAEKEIVVTAYAVQKAGFESAAAAWTATFGAQG